MLYRFKLRARSVDGAVYSLGDGDAWTSEVTEAPAMPVEECMRHIEDQRKRNIESDADSTIGKFVLVPVLV